MQNRPNMGVDIGSLKLKNPVLTASGTFGYAHEFEGLVDLNRLGGIIVKGLSLKPSKGNPPQRIVETSCGMLNAIGLENVGYSVFVRDKIPFLKQLSVPFFVNIYGRSVEEYAELAARLDKNEEIAGIEVNISCPNVKSGGMAFGAHPDSAFEVVQAVRSQTERHLMTKLSPNVTDIAQIAQSVEAAGADSISLINTLTGMCIDINTRRPRLANITGGLSGPAIKPIALRMVWEVVQSVAIPVIGIGGIMTAEDALEFLIAGAVAIQVGSANFVNPTATIDIIEGLESYLKQREIADVNDIIGSLEI